MRVCACVCVTGVYVCVADVRVRGGWAHLDPRLAQPQPQGQLLPREHVRVLCLLKRPLQLMQLVRRERRPTPTNLPRLLLARIRPVITPVAQGAPWRQVALRPRGTARHPRAAPRHPRGAGWREGRHFVTARRLLCRRRRTDASEIRQTALFPIVY